jgi:hypothetical protein
VHVADVPQLPMSSVVQRLGGGRGGRDLRPYLPGLCPG